MKLSDAIRRAMKLGETIRDYWDRELPKRHPNYPLVNPGEEELPPPPEEEELERFLTSLPGEMVYQIALIMNLGRRYFAVSELPEQANQLKRKFDPAELTFRLAHDSNIVEDLEDGLAELKKHGREVNQLFQKAVKLRK